MNLKSIFISVIGLLFFAFYLVNVSGVLATVNGGTLGGWAWSDTTGWLQTSSSTGARLDIDSSGNLNGYMWSENIGWIRFGDLTNFPTNGIGTTNDNAKFDSNNKLVGWVRACSVFATGCTGVLASNLYRGGWDGWISLSGTTNNGTSYGISEDSITGKLSGYAWGGGLVIGAIAFDNIDAPSKGVFVENFNPACPTVSLSSYQIDIGSSVSVTASPSTSLIIQGDLPVGVTYGDSSKTLNVGGTATTGSYTIHFIFSDPQYSNINCQQAVGFEICYEGNCSAPSDVTTISLSIGKDVNNMISTNNTNPIKSLLVPQGSSYVVKWSVNGSGNGCEFLNNFKTINSQSATSGSPTVEAPIGSLSKTYTISCLGGPTRTVKAIVQDMFKEF